MTTPSDGQVSVRRRQPADLPEAAAALVEVHRSDGYPVEGVDDPTAWLLSPHQIAAWVAELDGRIVGHVALTEPQPDDAAATVWTAHAGQPRRAHRGTRPAVRPPAGTRPRPRRAARAHRHRLRTRARTSTRPRRHDQGRRRHPALRTPRLAAHRHHPARRRPRPRHRRLLLRQPQPSRNPRSHTSAEHQGQRAEERGLRPHPTPLKDQREGRQGWRPPHGTPKRQPDRAPGCKAEQRALHPGTRPRRDEPAPREDHHQHQAREDERHRGDQGSTGTPDRSVPIPSQGMATTATTLAADLGVDEGDIDVLLELLDERTPELSDELAALPPSGARPTRRAHRAPWALLAGCGLTTAPDVRPGRSGSDCVSPTGGYVQVRAQAAVFRSSLPVQGGALRAPRGAVSDAAASARAGRAACRPVPARRRAAADELPHRSSAPGSVCNLTPSRHMNHLRKPND